MYFVTQTHQDGLESNLRVSDPFASPQFGCPKLSISLVTNNYGQSVGLIPSNKSDSYPDGLESGLVINKTRESNQALWFVGNKVHR